MGTQTTMPCAQAEDSGLLGPHQSPNWVKVCLVSTILFLPVTIELGVEKYLVSYLSVWSLTSPSLFTCMLSLLVTFFFSHSEACCMNMYYRILVNKNESRKVFLSWLQCRQSCQLFKTVWANQASFLGLSSFWTNIIEFVESLIMYESLMNREDLEGIGEGLGWGRGGGGGLLVCSFALLFCFAHMPTVT